MKTADLPLALLAGLAASQLTLLSRAGFGAFAIMAALSWIGGGVLLLERQQENPPAAALERLSAVGFGFGLLLLFWSLLVLSFAARLYDPLLHLVPLAALVGLGLITGLTWRSRLLLELALIGTLLPAQALINRFLPTGALAAATARLSALLLWLLGRPAFAEGHRIVLTDQVLLVDASCTGVNTLSITLATVLLLALLMPLPVLRHQAGLGVSLVAALALIAAFFVNALRVALLGLTSRAANPSSLEQLGSFGFWHEGLGSHLFSLLAMTLVCVFYVLALEIALRTSARPRR